MIYVFVLLKLDFERFDIFIVEDYVLFIPLYVILQVAFGIIVVIEDKALVTFIIISILINGCCLGKFTKTTALSQLCIISIKHYSIDMFSILKTVTVNSLNEVSTIFVYHLGKF